MLSKSNLSMVLRARQPWVIFIFSTIFLVASHIDALGTSDSGTLRLPLSTWKRFNPKDSSTRAITQQLNSFIDSALDEPFTIEKIWRLAEKFKGLSPEGRYKFSTGILWGVYAEQSLAILRNKAQVNQSDEPTLLSLVAINGPIVNDIGLVFGQSSTQQDIIELKEITVTPGMTGPNVARILGGFGNKGQLVVGLGSGINREVFLLRMQQENAGKVVLLEGPARSKVYIYVNGDRKTDFPKRGFPLQTPRQPLDASSGELLVSYLETNLLPAVTNRQFAVIGGQVFYGAPVTIVRKLLKVLKSKGYQVVFDPKEEGVDIWQAVLEESPAVIKPDLAQFADMLQLDPAVLSEKDGKPKFNDITLQALRLARQHNIKSLIVSLAEYGTIVVYEEKGEYRAILVRAPKVQVRGSISGGDTLIAGVLWKLIHGSEIFDPNIYIYGVAAAAATVQKSGTYVTRDTREVDAMVTLMQQQWGDELVTPLAVILPVTPMVLTTASRLDL